MAWIKGAPDVKSSLVAIKKRKKKERKDWIKRVNVQRKSEGLGPIANDPSRHGYSEPGWELRDKTDWMTSNPLKRHFRYEDGTTKPSPSRAINRPPTASKRNWPSVWRSLKRDRGIPGHSHTKHKVGKFLNKHAPSLSSAFKLDDQAPEHSFVTRPRAKVKYRSREDRERMKSEAGKSRAEKKRLKEQRENRRAEARRAAERRARLLNPSS